MVHLRFQPYGTQASIRPVNPAPPRAFHPSSGARSPHHAGAKKSYCCCAPANAGSRPAAMDTRADTRSNTSTILDAEDPLAPMGFGCVWSFFGSMSLLPGCRAGRSPDMECTPDMEEVFQQRTPIASLLSRWLMLFGCLGSVLFAL